MDKVAMVKQAEVNGVIAGLVDGGYVKLASEDDFNMVCEAVAGNVSDEWDFNEVIEKTAAVMEEVNAIYEQIEAEAGATDDLEKEASEADLLAAYGELTLLKQAEEIDDETYQAEATKLQKAMAAAKGYGDSAKDFAGKHKGKLIGGTAGALALLGAGAFAKKNPGIVKNLFRSSAAKRVTSPYLPVDSKMVEKWKKATARKQKISDAVSWLKNSPATMKAHPYMTAGAAGLAAYGGTKAYKGVKSMLPSKKED